MPVVVVFNRNAGNRGDRADLGSRLAGHGLGVLLTDYRGYGGNPGHPTEEVLARDARAAVAFLENQLPAPSLVYFGESLGAAVAIGRLRSHVSHSRFTGPDDLITLRHRHDSREAVGGDQIVYKRKDQIGRVGSFSRGCNCRARGRRHRSGGRRGGGG